MNTDAGLIDYRIFVEGKDKDGQVGDFIRGLGEVDSVSPTFSNLGDLFVWMRANGWRSQEHGEDGSGPMVPWAVAQVPTDGRS